MDVIPTPHANVLAIANQIRMKFEQMITEQLSPMTLMTTFATDLLTHMISLTSYEMGYVHLLPFDMISRMTTVKQAQLHVSMHSPPRSHIIVRQLIASVPQVKRSRDLLSRSHPLLPGEAPSSNACYLNATTFYDKSTYPHAHGEAWSYGLRADVSDKQKARLYFFRGLGRVWLGYFTKQPNPNESRKNDDLAALLRALTNILDDVTYRVYYRFTEQTMSHGLDLIARLAQNINNPTATILQNTQMLMHTTLNNKQNRLVHAIENESFAIAMLVNDVSDMMALQSKTIELKQDAFSLYECIDNAIQVVREDATRKTLTIQKQMDNQLPHQIKGDIIRLEQIVVNLLSNAVKYTEHGRITLKVMLDRSDNAKRLKSWYYYKHDDVERPDDDDETNALCVISVTVKDTGVGIEHDKLNQIFSAYKRPFEYQIQDNGNGLGLVICRELVELMDGRMWVRSVKNKGSTFGFSFITQEHFDLTTAKQRWRKLLDDKIVLMVCADEHTRQSVYNAFLFNTQTHVILYNDVKTALQYLNRSSQHIHAAMLDNGIDNASLVEIMCQLKQKNKMIALIGLCTTSGKEDDDASPFTHAIRQQQLHHANLILDTTCNALSHHEMMKRSSRSHVCANTAMSILLINHHRFEGILKERRHDYDYVGDMEMARAKLCQQTYDVIMANVSLANIRVLLHMTENRNCILVAILTEKQTPTECIEIKTLAPYLKDAATRKTVETMLLVIAERLQQSQSL